MEFFSKLNEKLDAGWKLTDTSCPICKSSIVYNPSDKSLFCIKCNLPIKMENEIVDNSEEKPTQQKQEDLGQSSEDYELIQKAEQKSKQNSDYSKKLSEYLLKGWAMLEDSCAKCYVPIMRSKGGDHICVACQWKKYVDPSSGKSLAAVLKAEETERLRKQYEDDQEKEQNEKEQKKLDLQAKQLQLQQQQIQQQQQQQSQQIQQQQQLSQQTNTQTNTQAVPQQNINTQAQQQLNDQIYSTLLKAAQFYDRQIEFSIQNNQVSQVEHLINHNLKDLIQIQQQLQQTKLN